MSEGQWNVLIKQNEVIISLLGRLAFKPDDIRKLVMYKKQSPEKYVEGYNACDGNHSLTEISKVVGVTSGTLSPILSEWEDIGILYQVTRPGGRFYKKLYPI